MTRFKTTPQSFKEVVSNGINLYWEGIKSLWIWSLLLALLSTIPNLIMAFMIKQQYSLSVLIAFDVVSVIFLPIISFLIAYIMYQLFLIGSQTKKSNQAVVSLIWDKLLIISASLFVTVLVSALGLGLFVIPGIFIGVMLIFVQPLILFDDNTFVQAFKNSWSLVQKNWWHIFSVLTIPLLLMYVAAPAIYSGNPSIPHILFDVIRMTIVTPLLFAFILTMFYDAKARHHVAMHLPRVRKDKSKAGAHASARGK